MDRLNRIYVLNRIWVFVFLFLTVWQVRIDTFLPWFFGVGFAWFLAEKERDRVYARIERAGIRSPRTGEQQNG